MGDRQRERSFPTKSEARDFASTLLAAGLPITTVADWLSHWDVNVTFRVYSHLLPDTWEQGREALEAA